MSLKLRHTLIGKALGVLLGVLLVSFGLIGLAYRFKSDLDERRARQLGLNQQEHELQFELFIATDLLGDVSARSAAGRRPEAALRHWRFALAELATGGQEQNPSPARAAVRESLVELDRILARPELPEDLGPLVSHLARGPRELALEIQTEVDEISALRLETARGYDRAASRNALLMLGVGLLGSLTVGLLAGRLFLSLARDLRLLQQRAEGIAGGGYGEPVELDRVDELGELGASINRMADALAEREAEIAIARNRLSHDEKLFALGSFAAGIAHEVANPISAIQAIALATSSRLAEDASQGNVATSIEQLQMIAEETERVIGLIDELGAFTLATPEQPTPTDVNQTLESAIRLLRFDPRFRTIRVATELAHDVPVVIAVPSQLTQVAINVLINAADAIGKEHGEIRVRTLADGEDVLISIVDDGHGMSSEISEKVLDPFFTTKEKGRGTGLGLAVCKTIIDEHHGTLEIDSVPGRNDRSHPPPGPLRCGSRMKILLVEDELAQRKILELELTKLDNEVIAVGCGADAVRQLEQGDFDVAVTDLKLPDFDGTEIIRRARASGNDLPILVITAYASLKTAISALQAGATDYLLKPIRVPDLARRLQQIGDLDRLHRENRLLRRLVQHETRSCWLPDTPAGLEVRRLISKVASTNLTLLIRGESGTGKGVVARLVHSASARSDGPFVSVNCGAMPENLIESELFGHAKGAFTGATHAEPGLFVAASGGTLFLDEIGDLPLPMQAKILHAIEEKAVRPVGSTADRPVDSRIIVATHRDLEEMARQGQFREDLLFRLNVFQIVLPTLREQKEALRSAVEHFLEKHDGVRLGRKLELDPSVWERFAAHDWPGNLRELENALERALVLCEGDVIRLADLPPALQHFPGGAETASGTLKERVEAFERLSIRATLEQVGGDRRRAAEVLGIGLSTLYRKLEENGEGE